MSNQEALRRLLRSDASVLKELRLYALQESAAFFGSSFDEEKNRSLQQFEDQIANDLVYGAFIDGELTGMACAYVSPFKKMSHKLHVYGVFVHPAYRGKGIMKQLLERLLVDAFQSHEVALASVVNGNGTALALFLACGFVSYGVETNGLKIDNHSYDLILLRCDGHGKR